MPGIKENGQAPFDTTFSSDQTPYDFVGCLLSITLISAAHCGARFLLANFLEHFLPMAIGRILEHIIRVISKTRAMIAHYVAHQTDECEIDRIAKRVAQLDDAVIIFLGEVLEVKQPAAGKKLFIRAGRVAPLHRAIEERL